MVVVQARKARVRRRRVVGRMEVGVKGRRARMLRARVLWARVVMAMVLFWDEDVDGWRSCDVELEMNRVSQCCRVLEGDGLSGDRSRC